MTSECYCKQAAAPRGEDNDIGASRRSRQHTSTTSAKSIIRKEACGSDGGSPGKARSVVSEKTADLNGPITTQTSFNLVLSPETSTALENAERVMNDARMQLAEVCATSGVDSATRNGNTCPDYPPSDDETEELLYIRELVASKFQEASHPSGPEVVGGTASLRRVNLLAPKFQMSQRRRADLHASLEQGHVSKDSSPRNERERREATIRNDDQLQARRRTSSSSAIAHSERLCAGACRIQTGPVVHVDGELMRQDLDVVHISPEPLLARDRANTATYVLRHRSVAEAEHRANNEPETAVSPGSDASRQEKRGRLIVAESTTEVATSTAKNENSHSETGPEEPRDHADGKKTGTRGSNSREESTSRAANGIILASGPADRKTVESSSGDDAENRRRAKAGRAFDRETSVDIPDQLRDEVPKNVMNKIQAEQRGDRSKPSENDVLRKAASWRRENISPRSPRAYRVIDEHSSITFHCRNGQNVLNEVSFEKIDRASTPPSCAIDFETVRGISEVELYRPQLDDFDVILQSNDKKIERVARATETFSKLLARLESSEYKLKEENPYLSQRSAPREEPPELKRKSSADDNREIEMPASNTTRLSIAEVELKRLSFGSSVMTRGTSASTNDGRSSAFTLEKEERSTKNSLLSVTRPVMSASDEEKPRGWKTTARLPSESSSPDKSDITTFSNLPPALSSTRTDNQISRQRRERIAEGDCAMNDQRVDVKSRIATDKVEDWAKNGFSEHEVAGDVFARILHGLRNEAADWFVAHVLQDEKQNIEKKVATALKESAITSTAVEKLLDRLREVDSAGNARPTETLGVLKNILTNVKNRNEEKVDGEDAVGSSSARQTQLESGSNEACQQPEPQLAVRSPRNFENQDEDMSDRCKRGETQESIRSALSSHSNESKRDSRAESESKQISDLQENPDRIVDGSPQLSSAKTSSMKSNERHEKKVEDLANATIPVLKNEEAGTSEKRIENESSTTRDNEDPFERKYKAEENIAPKIVDQANDEDAIKTINEETCDVTPAISAEGASSTFPAVAAGRDEQMQPEAIDNSRGSKVTSDVFVTKKTENADAMRPLTPVGMTRKNTESSHTGSSSRKDVAFPASGGITPANSCSADSLRDCASLRTSPSAKSGGLLSEEVESYVKKNSLDIVKGNPKDVSNGEARGSTTETYGFQIDTPTESSHSEGELYMPSSCSYSLGEVRILEKCDLIADNTLNHDSSVTILATRSMLTSLNDSVALNSSRDEGEVQISKTSTTSP